MYARVLRFTFCIAVVASLVTAVGISDASAQAYPQTTQFYYEGDLRNYLSSMNYDVGYRLDQHDVTAPFYVRQDARKIFAEAQGLRGKLAPNRIPKKFRPIVSEIERFIDASAPSDSAVKNKMSNRALAAKITLASFCFKTDPYAFAAMIWKESRFDQTRVSPTGAAGLTQMTGLAIDEVNDQLGNRGAAEANLENVEYWHSAIHCYTGGAKWVLMFGNKMNTLLLGQTVADHARRLAKAKSWIVSDVDRQLIYGQIALKVSLARARDNGLWGEEAYAEAFKNYNGDTKGGYNRKYSRGVLHQIKKI